MPIAIARFPIALQPSTQPTFAPPLPTTPFASRMKAVSSRSPVTGGSVVSTAIAGKSTGMYGSTSAVGQMNQDLLDAQQQNEAARQHPLQSGGNNSGVSNADLVQSQTDNMALLKLQIEMQRENQYFTMMSNILKTRHETLKTIIGNIR